MKTKKHFLVLVPHRDVRLALRSYSEGLFRAGFAGAYCFPWVAPLAALSRPLNDDELKHCARTLREATLREAALKETAFREAASCGDGKINAMEASFTAFPGEGNSAIFGRRLELAVPNDIGGQKAVGLFLPPVIGVCLTEADCAPPPPPPPFSFRAAAVANMRWQTLKTGGTAAGCKWKIGPLFWLPAVKKQKTTSQ